jgi:hypothetical protein
MIIHARIHKTINSRYFSSLNNCNSVKLNDTENAVRAPRTYPSIYPKTKLHSS